MLNRPPFFIPLLAMTITLGGCASAPSGTVSTTPDTGRTLVIPHGFTIQQAEPQGQPLTADEAQRQLPSRISAEDASRMLVFINPADVATPSAGSEAPAAQVPPTQTP